MKVYILLKMNVIKLSLHQIGLRVTGARTSGDSDGFTSSFQQEIYLNTQLYFHTAVITSRIKLILRDSFATLIE